MARQLFGTDGVRGRAGEFLTADLASAIARTSVRLLGVERPQVLIVRDTRESGEMLESAIAEGVVAGGGDALLGGVLPTPAAPLLLRRHGFDLAAVISASHNPYEDNGIKLFAADGFKLDDDAERQIEAELETTHSPGPASGQVRHLEGALDDYLGILQERFGDLDLHEARIVLDCANGATFRAAPRIFRKLGATVEVLADEPDGRNINARCGSTHLQNLIAAMATGEHDIGFAFDGDGDRVLAVDRNGAVVDGDELVALVALHLRSRGRLPGGGVVVTVMTNYGFHNAMRAAGIEVAVTSVGDRYVLDELRRRGWALGGEQSGHIIDLSVGPSGDGIAGALLALEALGGQRAEDRESFQKLPQRLINIRVENRRTLTEALEHPSVQSAIEREDLGLQGRGRVLVRPSGTEPLIRVMVEAPSEQEIDEVCGRISLALEHALASSQELAPGL
jgi:phosphoglucosamine mutase